MAKLTNCKDCDHEVSKKAKTCPNCGVSKPAVKTRSIGQLFGISVVSLIVIMVVFADPNASTSYSSASTTQRAATSQSSASSPAPGTDAVTDAYRLCETFEKTGMSTVCEVKGWGSTIDVTIDTNGGEARKICTGVVDMTADVTRSFAGNWKLQIFSPYSGEKPIAVCTLR